MAHMIDENHEALLRTLLGLEAGPELPQEVQDVYWTYKRLADRVGDPFHGVYLVLVAKEILGRVEEPPKTFLDFAVENNLERDTVVEVKWRNRWVGGRYQRVEQDRVVVILDDETAEERNIRPDLVRLPE